MLKKSLLAKFLEFFGRKLSVNPKKLDDAPELFRNMISGGPYGRIDLVDYLKKFLKKNFTDKLTSNSFKIYLYYGEGWGCGNFHSIYFDANYNFVLFNNKKHKINLPGMI
ncbi:MAG: hypothetical protein AAB824_00655, partial [Patescibacteria group bacterium]